MLYSHSCASVCVEETEQQHIDDVGSPTERLSAQSDDSGDITLCRASTPGVDDTAELLSNLDTDSEATLCLRVTSVSEDEETDVTDESSQSTDNVCDSEHDFDIKEQKPPHKKTSI